MNNKELADAVHSAMYRQCQKRGYAAPVDVLMDIGVLQKSKYEDWRNGRVPYLERVITMNLSKISTAMHEMRSYAGQNNLKPSVTIYKKWGKGRSIKLRFSKSGNPSIEERYSTHYVDLNRIAQLKAESAKKGQNQGEKL